MGPPPCPCLGQVTLCRCGPAQAVPGGPVEQAQLALPSPAPRDCVDALPMQSFIFFFLPSPSNVLEQCAHCQHMQLLIVCSRALQLQQGRPHYSWDEEQGTSVVWAISPLRPLLLLPLFFSFARKAWDRHAKSTFYQVWDSWFPFSSLKIAGELWKAEMLRFKGFVVSKGQSERHRHLKTSVIFRQNSTVHSQCLQSFFGSQESCRFGQG